MFETPRHSNLPTFASRFARWSNSSCLREGLERKTCFPLALNEEGIGTSARSLDFGGAASRQRCKRCGGVLGREGRAPTRTVREVRANVSAPSLAVLGAAPVDRDVSCRAVTSQGLERGHRGRRGVVLVAKQIVRLGLRPWVPRRA